MLESGLEEVDSVDIQTPPSEYHCLIYCYSSNIRAVSGGLTASGRAGITEMVLTGGPRLAGREVGGKGLRYRGVGVGADGRVRRGI